MSFLESMFYVKRPLMNNRDDIDEEEKDETVENSISDAFFSFTKK